MRRPHPLILHKLFLVILALAATILLALAILGVPIIRTLELFSMSLTLNVSALGHTLTSDTLQAHLGVLGFCHADSFGDCSSPGLPWHFFDDDIAKLRNVPGVQDAIQKLEDSVSGLVTGALVLFLIAGPLSLITLLHDLFRPSPALGSWTSVALSLLTFLLAIASYIASRILFGSVGDAVRGLAVLPGVTVSEGTSNAASMTLAAAILHFVGTVYKLVTRRRLRDAAVARNRDIEMRGVKY